MRGDVVRQLRAPLVFSANCPAAPATPPFFRRVVYGPPEPAEAVPRRARLQPAFHLMWPGISIEGGAWKDEEPRLVFALTSTPLGAHFSISCVTFGRFDVSL